MKKQLISRVLTIALLASLAASATACGGSASTDDTTAPSDTTPVETEPVEEPYSLGKYLEKKDLGGMTYTILAFYEPAINAIYVEEETGSLINDAVHKKIRAVEEFYNCDIKLSEISVLDNVTGASQTSTSIKSGEYEFDLVQSHDINMANQSLQQMYVNLMDYDDIFNFDAPWWPKNTIDSLSVNGKMYLMSNNVSYWGISDTRAMFFNKTLLENYQLDDPYELVRTGKWTFDKLSSMVKDLNKDVNNNSKWDAEDSYGIVNLYYYAWIESFGMEFFTEDQTGKITASVDVDKTTRAIEAVHNLYFLTNGGLPFTSVTPNANTLFKNGQAIFNYCSLRFAVSSFSDSNVIYGILPFPKLDENQETYYAGMTNKPLAIPVTVPEENRENVMLITEALNIEGYHTVFPAYYETALKARYADNDDDAQMIDIIYENSFFSFSYLYGDGSIYQTIMEDILAVDSPSLDVASYIAKNQNVLNARAEALTKFFAD